VPRHSSEELLRLLLLCLRLFRHLAADARQDFLERFLRAHLFAASFVPSIFMLVVTRSAARFFWFVSRHCHDRMIRNALAARAVIVDIIPKSGHAEPPDLLDGGKY
jgi:hypothetical protein